MKQKVLSILLLGLLSMLFAEIFSGASQLWFINPFGVFYTLPLYMFHSLFLLMIAVKTNRMNLRNLYWLGVLFGLYEAVITKVLWQGYMHEAEPALGTIFGVAAIEFPILVFFWHPIFSFILPIFTYEILTGNIILEHQKILTRSKKKHMIIFIMIIAISTFIVSGNQQDLISSFGALFGSILLIYIVYRLLKRKPIEIQAFEKIKYRWVMLILFVIYLFGAFVLLPERFPNTLMPYLTILFFYAVAITMFLIKTKVTSEETLEGSTYQKKHLVYCMILLIIGILISTFLWIIGEIILTGAYLLFTQIGLILVILDVLKLTKTFIIKHKNKS